MKPLILVCEGCGVRIRTSYPEKARRRDCPRCDLPLAKALDRARGQDLSNDSRVTAIVEPSANRRATAAVSILVTIGSIASLAVRESSPGWDRPLSLPRTLDRPVASAVLPTSRLPEWTEPIEASDDPRPLLVEDLPSLSRSPSQVADSVAILDIPRRDPIFSLPPPEISRAQSGLLDRQPPSPPRPFNLADVERRASSTVSTREPRRLLVRNSRGRALVAKEYGMLRDRLAVVLPDGQIGWPEGLVETLDPFIPASKSQVEQELRSEPELLGFEILATEHYLIAYQSSEAFARASAELLERLHDGLTCTLKRYGLPLASVEFPLVAVIFDTEQNFRASRRVAPDVQAYYEILSNRIFFYETSSRDQDSPEVSALRKPQTVAHEGTHQILHNVGVQPRLSDWPLWLVEGLAEYCSSTRFTKKGVEWAGLGQVNPIHLATIRDLDDPVPNQFRGGHREPVVLRQRGTPLVEYLVTRKELTPTDYAFSWALTHYLINQRFDDFIAYVKRMSELRPFEEQSPADQLAAFREIFGHDLGLIDTKVGKYLKRFKPNDALPHYAVIFEQPVGPIATRRHYMVSQSPSVIRQWIESVTAPEGGEPHWRIYPHLTQKKALEAAEQWMIEGR